MKTEKSGTSGPATGKDPVHPRLSGNDAPVAEDRHNDGPVLQLREADTRPRLLEIDRAKGLGIALVVWGHIAGSSVNDAPAWFYVSVTVIYSFHMPLFMYLSGYIFFAVAAHTRFWEAPKQRALYRANRLLVPFAILGTVITVGKYLVSMVAYIDDPVNNVTMGLSKIISNPPDNPSLAVWYLLVLFVYSITVPLIWRIAKQRWLPLLVLALIGWIIPTPEEYYIRRIAQFLLFFVVGGASGLNSIQASAIMRRWFGLFALTFCVACFLMAGHPLSLLVCGLASLPAIHGLFLQSIWSNDRLFLWLGRNSMAIYLLNTIAIGLAKLMFLRFFPHQGAWFAPFALFTFSAGLLAPILIRRLMSSMRSTVPASRYLS